MVANVALSRQRSVQEICSQKDLIESWLCHLPSCGLGQITQPLLSLTFSAVKCLLLKKHRWGISDVKVGCIWCIIPSVSSHHILSSELSKFHTYNLINFKFFYFYFPFYVDTHISPPITVLYTILTQIKFNLFFLIFPKIFDQSLWYNILNMPSLHVYSFITYIHYSYADTSCIL